MGRQHVEFKLRLTDSEHEALRTRADAEGLSLSDVLRQVIRSFENFAPSRRLLPTTKKKASKPKK
jgi:hypothetical protein